MDLTAYSPPAGELTKTLRVMRSTERRSHRTKKKTIALAMKLTAILLLGTFLHVSASGTAQGITLQEKNASLEKVFKAIEKQTGYLFWYNSAVVQNTKKINIQLKNATLEQALQACFEGQSLTYTIVNKTIVVRPIVPEEVKEKSALPPVDVKGRVVNENGEPIAGATIAVKGTKIATASNGNGEFILSGLNENAVIVVSSVGYESQEVRIYVSLELLIQLKQSISKLDEVKIIGYGTTTQRFNTSSVSKVTSKEISMQPVSNPLQALQGRIPGLYITQLTGTPGGGLTVRLRGQNSIANGNDPLYIIDGVPFTSTPIGSSMINSGIIAGGNPLSNINPADIESIEVLRDADATAIYGSRGANGVVLVTTKKGKIGTTKMDLNFYSGVGKVTRMMNLLNTSQYLIMRREAFMNDGVTPTISNARDLLEWDTTRYIDMQKELIGGTAHTMDVQTSVSGGNQNTQFLLGGGYHRESTVFPGDYSDKKITAHLNLTHASLNKKFQLSFLASFVSDKNKLLSLDPTLRAITLPPNIPSFYDSTGNLIWHTGVFFNPYADLRKHFTINSSNLVSNAVISYEILTGLQLKTSMGYTQMQMNEISTNPIASLNPSSSTKTGSASFADNSFKTWIIEPQLNYQKKVGGSELNILMGITFNEEVRQGQTLRATGFINDALVENIAASAAISTLNAHFTKYRYNAVFGRINYRLQSKYLLNLTARRDGSSRFGPGKQFANFGAIGAGWIFSEEVFFQKKFPFLSFGKIRGSYGITGNDQLTDYQYLDTYSPTAYPYMGAGGLFPTRLFNPDFAWEVNKKIESAMELGFLRDRIFFTTSYYHNRSSNQLVGYSLPLITGGESIQFNLPATIQNSGWEFELSSVIIKTGAFVWNSAFNLSIPKNKLVAYPNFSASTYTNSYIIGRSLFTRKKFHYVGVDPQTGIYQFEDVDGNGSISSPADLQGIKKVGQIFHGGISNSFQYQNWSLDIFVQFAKQTNYNYVSAYFPAPGRMNNQPIFVLDRWQDPGDITSIQKFTQNTTSEANRAYVNSQSNGDNSISDASFIRLKNLSLSYNLPFLWMMKNHLKGGKVYIQGQNLLTLTRYKGMDPESGHFGYIPPLKVLTAGFLLTF